MTITDANTTTNRSTTDSARRLPPASLTGALTVEVHRSFDDLTDIRDEWDALVQSIGGDLFATFDWCDVWWKHYGVRRSLEIHTVRRDGVLIAALPLFRETVRIGPVALRVVRLVGCDHGVTTCQLIMHPGDASAVLDIVLNRIAELGRWDVLSIGPLPGYSDQDLQIVGALRECDGVQSVTVRDLDPHMLFDLPSDFDAYLKGLSTKERRNVRRDERKLEDRGPITRRCVDDPEQVQEAFTAFITLHQQHWTGKRHLGHFGDWPDAEAFHREMVDRQLQRKRLTLITVHAGDDLVASEYAYHFADRAHWILAARQPRIPGRIGYCALVREAMERGVTCVDGLRGLYEYKRLLGARIERQKMITATRSAALGSLKTAMFRVAARWLDLLYYRLWFCRVAPRIGWRPKPLWRIWIRSRI